ncbi:piggyBac transposable element-derived protein 4-like [Sardina pilchardus]|uniref:piggyBac transposable element-derived protein 4-like n=1 Tax=Sardina pilchardus TaxID=27697 RepID=UPI002E0DA424
MCSTFHQAHAGETTQRRVKDGGTWSVRAIPVPPAVKDYNRNMGGVDLSDALIGYYSILHKTRRWYRSFFYHFLDIAIVNGYILNKEISKARRERPMSQKAFRENLVQQLQEAGSFRSTTPTPQPHPGPSGVPRVHLPTFLGPDGTQGRRRCKLCNQKSPIACSSCEVVLCMVPTRNCYSKWHEQTQP